MRVLLVICAIAALMNGISSYKQPSKAREYQIARPRLIQGAFSVMVDYFRPQDDTTDIFAYHLYIDHFEDDGPLYFYVNDAGIYTTHWIENGLMNDIAADLGGALLTADHRYYGDNIPTDGASWSELDYLTIEQSISDIAYLIVAAKAHLADDVGRVVVWGSGYGGVLAVWAKQKYPHLIDGVWASSSVFERMAYTSEPYEYLEEILETYGGQECLDRVEDAFSFIGSVIDEEDDDDLEQLQNDLFTCDPVNTTSIAEVGSFFEILINFIGNHIADNDLQGIVNFCSAMNAIPADPFASFVRWVVFQHNLDVGPCLNLDYEDRLTWTQHEDWDAPPEFFGWRQSLYLICTQLGLLRVTTDNSIFGDYIPREYHNTICQDAFGDNIQIEQLPANIERLKIMHGGTDPSIENVIFTNGELDSFYPLIVTDNNQEDSHAISIPLVGRSADLDSLSPSDSQALYEAKLLIINRVTEWSATEISPSKNKKK